jgi:hypothetical protein
LPILPLPDNLSLADLGPCYTLPESVFFVLEAAIAVVSIEKAIRLSFEPYVVLPVGRRLCRSALTTGDGPVPSESPIFTVVHAGKRTTAAFRDWPSARERFFSLDLPDFLETVRAELDEAITENRSTVLALDMAPAEYVPSSFWSVLLAMRKPGKHGMSIELLHPTVTVRVVLETMNLDQVFVVQE